ncbi:flagellar protein FlaG [Virgibacillus halophilus]|uniref:Flagellar protein FlaG n=1 Tax=Tigheibacillus halophilus TaxID=361280 RepID=A0ABU5C1S2_9BACI|nr:flagellar protein FlaG [Virgibacillus halophilus]
MRIDGIATGLQGIQSAAGSESEKVEKNVGLIAEGQDNENAIKQKKLLKNAISEINSKIELLHTDLKFKLHEELNEYYAVVVNPLTDEVIKEIPPKKMLDKYAAMAEFMGIITDEKI